MSNNNQPIYILPEGSNRTIGKDAQRNNIMAAKLVAETVRTTLGPKGMDKMLVDSMGDVVVTNDGVTILNEMQIEHPAAKMVVEVAKTQEEQVGDGTTTAVILAGELLKNAEQLLDKEIHPTVITKGYRLAANKTQEILNNIAEDVSREDNETLLKIAVTAMAGKNAEPKEKLGNLVVKAVKSLSDNLDIENIKIEKNTGNGTEDSELIQGIVLDKEKLHSQMPSEIKEAKILLLDAPIEIKDTETDAKIQITDPSQLQSFLDQEQKMIKSMTEKIINSGANVVLCQKGIDDLALHYLAKANIYACRRITKSDMDKLARATGAKVLSSLDEINKLDLGLAGRVYEKKTADEEFTYITDCQNAKAVTLLIRGGTEHVVNEVERAVKDAIGDIIAALKTKKVVAGAGSPEMEVSKRLREFANTLSGREQLAVLSFAESIEAIPRTLAENAGYDPIDILTELKASHDSGNKWAGLDVFTGKVVDAWKMNVIEPLQIKTQAVKSASEVAELILRIDDIIAAGNLSGGKNVNPQVPMPGMM